MRLWAYAGASTALAAGVVVYAFNQRTNFYSACVYLSQSNLCLMILTNLILFLTASFMFGLQRLFYGPLRPIEIEQLYEKAWFAITETCLAMTIFREEVGAWFLVMFVALLAGKVWGWIGEGRVEILEQQPPANPRLFHIRLSLSLALSLAYDISMLSYTVNTVIQDAKPNMMVMFLFEFAILLITSVSTTLRYGISLIEERIVKKQTKERMEAARLAVRTEREQIIAQRAAAVESGEVLEDPLPALPSEDDVDEMDIEVPGWEVKGHYVLSLDLLTDFFKLAIYSAFFFILLTFYGLPIHIMRDLFITARSFVKRLTAFIKYRRATSDMNSTYPDATVEEIQREDTCIICREEMVPWSVTNPENPPAVDGAAPRAATSPTNERSRPKKLPCGHVLHLGCLKSWLERQQVCPTCRRPVVDSAATAQAQRAANAAQARLPAQPGVPGQAAPFPAPLNPRQDPPPNMRVINFGPLRLAVGNAPMNQMADRLQQNQPRRGRMYGLEFGFGRRPQQQNQDQDQNQNQTTEGTDTAGTIQDRLQDIEHQIMTEIRSLQASQQELQIVQLLQAELTRLRSIHDANANANAMGNPIHTAMFPPLQQQATGLPTPPMMGQMPLPNFSPFPTNHVPGPTVQRHGVVPGTSAIPAGSTDLPPGVTIPDGWSLMPLQRLDPHPHPQLHMQSGPLPNPLNTMLQNMTGATPAVGTPVLQPNAPQGMAPPVPTRAVSSSHPEDASAAPATERAEQIASPPSSVPAPAPAPSTSPISPAITTTTTTTTLPAPTALPNWGGSQLFGRPSPAGQVPSFAAPPQALFRAPQTPEIDEPLLAATPTTSAPAPFERVPEPVPEPESSSSSHVPHDTHTAVPEGNAEEVKDKGKAKAVTIEDQEDEDA